MDAALIYLLVLETLSVVMITFLFMYVRRKTIAKNDGKQNWVSVLLTFLAFTGIGIACNHYVNVPLDGLLITPRDFIVMFSALAGGPLVGLPTAAFLGGGRLLIGGISTMSAMISVTVPFLLGTLLWYISKKKFPDAIVSAVLMFLSKVISLGLILMYSPGGFAALNADVSISSISVCTIAMFLTVYLCRKKIYKEEAESC